MVTLLGQTAAKRGRIFDLLSGSKATIRNRIRKDCTASFQVRWLQGGRGGSWESERFGESAEAEAFKKLVDAHGQQWPFGWVSGQGFVEPEQDPDDVPLVEWSRRYVERLTGIDKRTRDDYLREVDCHLSLFVHTTRAGQVMPATIGNITADDVQDWIRLQEAGQQDPETGRWIRRPATPKSTANRHGLLWCIVQAAIEADPPLRTKNCCAGTRLPRADDEIVEEMVFLEHDEYQLIRRYVTDEDARDLADWLVGEQEMLGFLLSAIGPQTDDIPQGELAPEKAADFLRTGGAPVDLLLDEETLRGLRECFERNPHLQTSHVPSRFHGNVVLFASTLGVTNHRKETWEPAEAWPPYVTGDIDVHDVSSEHDRMMQPQALSEIGPVLSTILNQIV